LWGYISDVNDAILKLYGCTDKKEIIGKHMLDFLPKEERARAVQDSLDLIVKDKDTVREYTAVVKNGEKVRLEVSIEHVRDKMGEKIGFVDVIKIKK
jgi:PAS domain S-box-containing protein